MVATIVPQADLSRERRELAESIGVEHEELANIYVKRGLKPELEKEVSRQVMAKDALGAHARDELGNLRGRRGAAVAGGGHQPPRLRGAGVSIASLLFLAVLGAVGAKAGGADIVRGVLRVTFCRAIAMAATALIGKIFGTVVRS